jgi:hypothetical protein
MTRRGTTNRNARGGSDDRRVRRLWLVETFGDGLTVACAFGCGRRLTVDTVTVDRYPVAGVDGGTYARGNIRPACAMCNYARRRVPISGQLTSCHPDWWRLDWPHDVQRPEATAWSLAGHGAHLRCAYLRAPGFRDPL